MDFISLLHFSFFFSWDDVYISSIYHNKKLGETWQKERPCNSQFLPVLPQSVNLASHKQIDSEMHFESYFLTLLSIAAPDEQ